MINKIQKRYEENEHSLEMHMPFIQKIFRDAQKEYQLIPIMVGSLKKDNL
jgi:AmmeMemoRadiSam system protein B